MIATPLSDAGEPGRKRRSGLPGADDDRVEVFNIAHVLIFFPTEPSNRADRPPKAEINQAVVEAFPGRSFGNIIVEATRSF